MSYQLYRNTTLGHTLQESLDDLIQVPFLQSNFGLFISSAGKLYEPQCIYPFFLFSLLLHLVRPNYAQSCYEGVVAVRQVD